METDMSELAWEIATDLHNREKIGVWDGGEHGHIVVTEDRFGCSNGVWSRERVREYIAYLTQAADVADALTRALELDSPADRVAAVLAAVS
jgi:hypothetical protein